MAKGKVIDAIVFGFAHVRALFKQVDQAWVTVRPRRFLVAKVQQFLFKETQSPTAHLIRQPLNAPGIDMEGCIHVHHGNVDNIIVTSSPQQDPNLGVTNRCIINGIPRHHVVQINGGGTGKAIVQVGSIERPNIRKHIVT